MAKDPGFIGGQPGLVGIKEHRYCKAVGNGNTALKYLAPYVFRVAAGKEQRINNRRLVKLENNQVTCRHWATDTGEPKLCTLSAEEFIHWL